MANKYGFLLVCTIALAFGAGARAFAGQILASAAHTSGIPIGIWVGTSVGTGDDTRYAGTVQPSKIQHFALVIQRNAAGRAEAFVINPELNAGARIGTRTVSRDGSTLRLTSATRPALVATLRGQTIVMQLPGASGTVALHPATAAERALVTGTSRDSVAIGAAPPAGGDGWVTGLPAAEGANVVALRTLVRNLGSPRAALRVRRPHSLLVARHGRLVVERYFGGYGAADVHDLRSAGKSLATLLVGLAQASDRSLTPTSRVLARVPDLAPARPDPRKERMTVGDLMTMRSGLACDDNDDNSPGNEDTMQSQRTQPDWYRYALALPMLAEPGTRGVYCSAGINLLGAIIARAAHRSIADLFARDLAAPLAIRRYALPLAPGPGHPAYLGGGQMLTPRDFLKFAQLVLDDGRWRGRQVVASAWMRAISTPRAHVEDEIGEYGYGWHLYRYRVGGQIVRVVSAGGNGGQLLFAIPRYGLAIAITAGNYQQYPVWRSFITSTVPAVIDAFVPGNSASKLIDR